MAVKLKSVNVLDKNSGSKLGPKNHDVHYVKVGKFNRKGVAATVGGELFDHIGSDIGDFHINLETKVNGKLKMLSVEAGDVVFRTNDSKRWQVLSGKGFSKRFPAIKIKVS